MLKSICLVAAWHTARMSVPDSSPANQPPSPMRLLSTSPGPGGYGRVPVTDDVDDERFHDGLPTLPSAAAGLVSTSCGATSQTRMGKYLQPLSIPSPAPGPPGAWSRSSAIDGAPWGMSELGSVMSGAGDTSRMTGTATFGTGDVGGTSSTPFGESPGAMSTVRPCAALSWDVPHR